MKQTVLNIVTVLTLALIPMVTLVSSTAYAAPRRPSCGTPSSSKTQVLRGIGETGSNCSSSGVRHILNAVVQILSFVVGAVAIIMIIYSGFKYITSSGQAEKVAAAKSSLIYALVGLVIAVLAQTLVHFVINTADQSNPCTKPGRTKLLKGNPKCK